MSGENINIPKDMLSMMKELLDMGAVGFGGFVDDNGKVYPITLGQIPSFTQMPKRNPQPTNKTTCDEDCSCSCHDDEEYRSCDCFEICDGCSAELHHYHILYL